jgi:hypothetical protein
MRDLRLHLAGGSFCLVTVFAGAVFLAGCDAETPSPAKTPGTVTKNPETTKSDLPPVEQKINASKTGLGRRRAAREGR